jgi:hypothetical protein
LRRADAVEPPRTEAHRLCQGRVIAVPAGRALRALSHGTQRRAVGERAGGTRMAFVRRDALGAVVPSGACQRVVDARWAVTSCGTRNLGARSLGTVVASNTVRGHLRPLQAKLGWRAHCRVCDTGCTKRASGAHNGRGRQWGAVVPSCARQWCTGVGRAVVCSRARQSVVGGGRAKVTLGAGNGCAGGLRAISALRACGLVG